MRAQTTRIRTGAVIKRILTAAAVLVVAAIAAAICHTIFYAPPYLPPPFETSAQTGTPKPPENMGYGRIDAENGFYFSTVGTIYQQEDRSLLIYLTNHGDSGVWLMCEIADENGNTLYKSGVLRQGEYVERLYPERKFANEAIKVEMRIYGFEPETYHSVGSVFLNNTLQPW